MPSSSEFWNDLFPAGNGAQQRLEMRLLRKHGRPFLLLPRHGQAAVAALSLYPAQTGKARAARAALGLLLRAGLPMGTEPVSFSVLLDDPFVQFLASMATGEQWDAQVSGARGKALVAPELGILAGNPNTEGQRFMIVVFGENHRPAVVVKTGLSERARTLIEKETTFLEAAVGRGTSIPKVRASFQNDRVRALALDFFAGDSPRLRDATALPALLGSWVDSQRTVALVETPDWLALEKAASASNLFPQLAKRLRVRAFHPVIHHGDFAPWNIKISPEGNWTVLDWERGELNGIPGWDWFHYVIQTAILVEHRPTAELVQLANRLLNSEDFRRYAERAGIAGFEKALLQAYLLHMVEVIKPSEGLAQSRGLVQALAED